MSIQSLPLLLEIGTEEIPDWMIPGALDSLRAMFEKLEVPHQSLRLDATPRRLVLRAEGLPAQQDDSDKRTLGPPTSAPAQAVAGFARKQGVAPDELTVEDGYYVVFKKVTGRSYQEILSEALPGLIQKIYFPKTMYWTGKAARASSGLSAGLWRCSAMRSFRLNWRAYAPARSLPGTGAWARERLPSPPRITNSGCATTA